MTQWRKIIEPENGVDILAYFPDADTPVMIVHWIKTDDPADDGDWYEQNVDRCPEPLWVEPTHWMPLPELPR